MRARLHWLGLEIHGSAATGYCLRPTAVPEDRGRGGFEEELPSVTWET